MHGVYDVPDRAQRPRSRTALVASVAFTIILAAVGTVGWRWYHYVTAGASPYDEVGIEVNRRLPESLRAWGCARQGALPARSAALRMAAGAGLKSDRV